MPILLIHICYSLQVKNCKQGTLDSIADHMCYELNVCIPQNAYAEVQPMEQASFDFVAAVIIPSDFGVQENKICHSFHVFPFYLPYIDATLCDSVILVLWMLNFKPAF